MQELASFPGHVALVQGFTGADTFHCNSLQYSMCALCTHVYMVTTEVIMNAIFFQFCQGSHSQWAAAVKQHKVIKIKNQWLHKLKLVLHYIMQNNELDLGLLAKFPEITLHSQILMLPASITCSMEAMEVEFGVRVWERGSSSSCMHLPLTHGVLSYTMSSFHSHLGVAFSKASYPRIALIFRSHQMQPQNTQLTPTIFSLSYHFIREHG